MGYRPTAVRAFEALRPRLSGPRSGQKASADLRRTARSCVPVGVRPRFQPCVSRRFAERDVSPLTRCKKTHLGTGLSIDTREGATSLADILVPGPQGKSRKYPWQIRAR